MVFGNNLNTAKDALPRRATHLYCIRKTVSDISGTVLNSLKHLRRSFTEFTELRFAAIYPHLQGLAEI